MTYNKWQLRKFARRYIQDYDLFKAADETNIPREDVDKIINDGRFVEQLNRVQVEQNEQDDHKVRILDWICAGKTLVGYQREFGTPAPSTVCLWRVQDKEFDEAFERARDSWCHVILDEMLDIADNMLPAEETEESDKGTTVRTKDAIKHRKLQIEVREKVLKTHRPQQYANLIKTAASVLVDAKVETKTDLTDPQLARKIMFLVNKGVIPDESTK